VLPVAPFHARPPECVGSIHQIAPGSREL
jgi:hypothetical protein